MRTVQHWRPRYLLDRSAEKLYSRIHPDAPWLTARADEILADLLRPTDIGLEFGSGRSTTWLARRISHLTSVEHDRDWQRKVSAGLQAEGIGNVTYVYAPGEVPDERGGESEYARAALRVPDQSLDLVLVDGMYRDHCAALAIPKIKPGGLMVVDNVNWYLPSGSRSPNSRTQAQGPATPVWAQVLQTTQDWRSIWTSPGVWDTAIIFKPA